MESAAAISKAQYKIKKIILEKKLLTFSEKTIVPKKFQKFLIFFYLWAES